MPIKQMKYLIGIFLDLHHFAYYLLVYLEIGYLCTNKISPMARTKKSESVPVRIRFKELRNGNKSIYLDIYKWSP